MRKRLMVYLVVALVALVPLVRPPVAHPAAAADIQLAQSSPEKTQLMQQSDHRRRLDQERKARAEQSEVIAVTEIESRSAGLDHVVLVILVASVVILIFVSAIKQRARVRR